MGIAAFHDQPNLLFHEHHPTDIRVLLQQQFLHNALEIEAVDAAIAIAVAKRTTVAINRQIHGIAWAYVGYVGYAVAVIIVVAIVNQPVDITIVFTRIEDPVVVAVGAFHLTIVRNAIRVAVVSARQTYADANLTDLTVEHLWKARKIEADVESF